jgi:isoleucyl-tRNA synthetase
MFHSVSSKVDFAKEEEKVLAFWKEKKVFEKSVNLRKGNPRFQLYEGPPTANGNPGIHHVLTRVFKDVMPRYKAMKGFYAPRIAGWDTHGLPVELEVEKKLGISNKSQIEEYGIARFNEKCRESVSGYLKNWDLMTERIGYWVDLDHPYVTMDNDYMESCWWTIKQLWEKGLIYQGYRVTPHCPRCGTSLSSHEVALGYQENTEDPSVFIKFKIVPFSLVNSEFAIELGKVLKETGKPAYFLVWTTTPWTLPGNTALAVSGESDYAVIEDGEEILVMANQLKDRVGLGDRRVLMSVKGRDLISIRYEPLYNPHKYGVERRRPAAFTGADGVERKEFRLQSPDGNLTYRVVATDFVTMDDGTGIVHVAPAFGEADFQAGLDNDLDFVQQVDLQGKIVGEYPFAHKFVKSADKEILSDLQIRNLLFKSEKILHTYPFCWRCSTPLLYYAKQTWYIRTTAVKDKLIANNKAINWYPEYIKNGRFGDWLQNNVDWAFSRERYWGTPLPIWRCEGCSKCECVGGIDELAQKAGVTRDTLEKGNLGVHRPVVDELVLRCPACGGQMKRVPDVIDCWFDSGDMPIAQFRYPFDPNSRAIFDDGRFPADYICEAIDQTRGWFYSLHAISTLLFDQPAFKNVICLGHVLDAEGEKMSKSKGNVVDPWKVINKHGADALRWYCLTAVPPANVRRFSEDLVAEITRRFQLILWNVYSFFVMYANIDNFNPAVQKTDKVESELDKWILSELNQLVIEVDSAIDSYNPTDAGRKIEEFVNDLSNWYVRRSRRRFWKSENDTDKLSAYNTLYECLVTLSKLLAPLAPFMAEELYQNLVRSIYPDSPESVHMADFPSGNPDRIDRELTLATQLAIKVCSLGRAARSQSGIKVRQPLAHIVVGGANPGDRGGLQKLKPQVLDELNIKDIRYGSNEEVAALNGKGYMVAGIDLEAKDETQGKTPGGGGHLVAVSTEITSELAAEGLTREIVHRLQTMRKSAGFEIADYIRTYYEGDEYIQQVMKDFADYIKQETLSRQISVGVPPEGVFSESLKLSGRSVKLGVRKESA